MKIHLLRKLFFGLAATFLLAATFTQQLFAQYPTDSAQISLLTVSPGDEIYSFFGHTAIRTRDTRHNFDITYGYGTFDFDTPHFYEKFVFGRLLYKMAIIPYDYFMLEYQSNGQAVYQQSINLTNKERWRLIQNLQTNYQPENRYYRYDFLYDNCSTRIRDMIEKSVDGKIIYDSIPVKKHETFRDLLANALCNEPWVALGINTMLGHGSDKIADRKTYLFLPSQMMNALSTSFIQRGNTRVDLLGKPSVLLNATLQQTKPNPYTSPDVLFSLFAIVVFVISYLGYRKNIHSRWFDIIVFSITGLLGLLFLAIWIGSLHVVMACNMNILWANPLNILIVIFLSRKFIQSSLYLYVQSLLLIMFIAYIPLSILLTHHVFIVPMMVDLILIIRLLYSRK